MVIITQEIVNRALDGDADARDQIAEAVYRILRSGGYFGQEDAIQEYFLILFRLQLAAFDESKANFASYIHYRFRFFLKDFYRGKRNQPTCHYKRHQSGSEVRSVSLSHPVPWLDSGGNGRLVEVGDTIPVHGREDEYRRFCEAIMPGLSQRERLFVIMYYWMRCTQAEIASQLGLSASKISHMRQHVNSFIRRRETERQDYEQRLTELRKSTNNSAGIWNQNREANCA